MTFATLVLAAVAALMLAGFLLWRPALSSATKIWLFVAIFLLPFGAAMTGNVAGFETSKRRTFCASCHIMDPYTRDAAGIESESLSAIHSRNRSFGDQSCYACHRDYGMFGQMTTKIAGLRHLWIYYSGRYEMPLRLRHEYPNANCTQCHSTTLPGFAQEPEHAAVTEEIRSGAIGCAEAGCHGPAHPGGGGR